MENVVFPTVTGLSLSSKGDYYEKEVVAEALELHQI
jgi:hypothetical protein